MSILASASNLPSSLAVVLMGPWILLLSPSSNRKAIVKFPWSLRQLAGGFPAMETPLPLDPSMLHPLNLGGCYDHKSH